MDEILNHVINKILPYHTAHRLQSIKDVEELQHQFKRRVKRVAILRTKLKKISDDDDADVIMNIQIEVNNHLREMGRINHLIGIHIDKIKSMDDEGNEVLSSVLFDCL